MTTVTVRDIPSDIAQFILRVQGEVKEKKVCGNFSQAQTIIHIVKEYKKITSGQ